MMTREAARIEVQTMIEIFHECEPGGSRCQAALEVALSALHPISREQVEKVWRGCADCIRKTCVACKRFGWAPRHCIDCDNQSKWAPWNFCPVCGKPMTDEAVQMVMERMEEIHHE